MKGTANGTMDTTAERTMHETERTMDETSKGTMNETTNREINETAKKTMNENAQKQEMRTQIHSERLALNGRPGPGALGLWAYGPEHWGIAFLG